MYHEGAPPAGLHVRDRRHKKRGGRRHRGLACGTQKSHKKPNIESKKTYRGKRDLHAAKYDVTHTYDIGTYM